MPPDPLSAARESLMLQAPHLRPSILQRSGSGGLAAGFASSLTPSPASLGGQRAPMVPQQLLMASQSLQLVQRTSHLEGSSTPADRLAAATRAVLAGGAGGGGSSGAASMPGALRMAFASAQGTATSPATTAGQKASSSSFAQLLQLQQQAAPQRADLRPAKRVLQRSAVSCLSDGESMDAYWTIPGAI